jgi:Ca2+-binding RTX toxin-like protein
LAINTLIGGLGNDTLDGGAGADILNGGAGDDTYFVDVVKPTTGSGGDVINETTGNDTVKTTFSADLKSSQFVGIENLTLLGAALNATGDEEANELTGNDGANTLDGGAGADKMDGGKGNDTYIVDHTSDTVAETNNSAASGGIDTVLSSVTFGLGANIENLTLNGVGAMNGFGNELNNTITGNNSANFLDGGAGVDTLKGNDGDDIYIVEAIKSGATAIMQDMVAENFNQGVDTVYVRTGSINNPTDLGLSAAATLLVQANIETFSIQDTGNNKFNITGNVLNNLISGNAADNIIDGGAGTDTLSGGLGNDTYIVDIFGSQGFWQDSIVENGGIGEGVDTLKLRGSVVIPAANLATVIDIGDQPFSIENLDVSLTGSTRYDLVGSSADNILIGNSANNDINGDFGNDTLNGGGGNDTLRGGVDIGNDILDGGTGGDLMIGGSGNDTYFVDSATDIVRELAGQGIDTVKSSINYVLLGIAQNGGDDTGRNVENIELTGAAAINATGNHLSNTIIGNAAANILTGGDGSTSSIDTLIGNGGNDKLIGGIGNDILDGGADNDTLDGNAGNDTVKGGTGIDTLNGGEGNDTLIGGIGNDTLLGGLGADTFKWELADKGTNGSPSVDILSDFSISQNDILDLRDLLQDESINSLFNYIDFTTNSGNTEIRISSNGGFAGGIYSAGNENAHLTLLGVDLFTATGSTTEANLLQNLITQNKLITDV